MGHHFLFCLFCCNPSSLLSLLSVGVKSAYSPATSTVYSQPPPPPQRQVTALKPLAPACSVSTSYNIYPVSTSVQQPPTPISSYTLESSFASTVSAATTYSGDEERSWTVWTTFFFLLFCVRRRSRRNCIYPPWLCSKTFCLLPAGISCLTQIG